MLAQIKKMIPESVKERLRPFKVRLVDEPRKRKLTFQMQKKHQELLEKIKEKDRIKVVFLAIHKSVWKVDSVFQRMLRDPLFEPLILVCPYIKYGEKRMWEDMRSSYRYFKQKNYPVLFSYDQKENRWITLEEIQPHIVFFTNPHNLTRNEYYQEAFLNYLSCYVPYYFMITKHAGSYKDIYNTLFFNSLWRFYATSEENLQSYIAHSINKCSGLCVGYPALEGLVNNNINKSNHAWDNNSHSKIKIIYAPHHTIDGDDNSLSTFLQYGEYILELSKKYKETFFWSFKPHPMLKSKLYEHPDWGVDKTNRYYENWKTGISSQFDDGEYEQLFVHSNAIIHDCSSFIVEYAVVKKPALYLVNSNTFNLLTDLGENILTSSYKLALNQQDIEVFIQSLIDKDVKHEKTNKIESNELNDYIEKLFINESPSKKIINDIKYRLNSL